MQQYRAIDPALLQRRQALIEKLRSQADQRQYMLKDLPRPTLMNLEDIDLQALSDEDLEQIYELQNMKSFWKKTKDGIKSGAKAVGGVIEKEGPKAVKYAADKALPIAEKQLNNYVDKKLAGLMNLDEEDYELENLGYLRMALDKMGEDGFNALDEKFTAKVQQYAPLVKELLKKGLPVVIAKEQKILDKLNGESLMDLDEDYELENLGYLSDIASYTKDKATRAYEYGMEKGGKLFKRADKKVTKVVDDKVIPTGEKYLDKAKELYRAKVQALYEVPEELYL